MEQESDTVSLGKLIHETSYEREKKEIEIDHVKLDWLDIRDGVLHEVKKSDSFEEAHEWQVLYYLWYLKQKGVEVQQGNSAECNSAEGKGKAVALRGEINYPKLRKKIEVVLTPQKETELENILKDVEAIVEKENVPERLTTRSLCKKCSYYDLCWVE